MGRSNKHQLALEYLAQHPELIGLSKRIILTASIEQILFYQKKVIPIDLVYMVKDPKLRAIIVEYKANGDEKAIERGRSQLNRAVSYYQDHLEIPAEGRLITGSSYPILRNIKK